MRTAAFVLALLLAQVPAPSAQAEHAADAYFDPAEMARARAALKRSHGAQINTLLLGERLELGEIDGDAQSTWEAQGWRGSDRHKLWLKTEGEYEHEEQRFEEAELQVLYSRAVAPFWDLQAGLRHDVTPNPSRTYAVIGLQGLAPYWFELDGALFLSDRGDLSARLEAEYELRFTQRLILQPRLELNAALSSDEAIGTGRGLSTAQAGLRLRYEFKRRFAPYLGVRWARDYGQTRRLRRERGEPGAGVTWLAGLRFWF
ncbi:MAG: copper resistance protein B [Pseudomonadota bacterium]